MKKQNLSLKSLVSKIADYLYRLKPYSLLIFLLFVALIYGSVIMTIQNLSSATPSDIAVSGQVQAAQIPHIDESVVNQLQSLQDNSVSVQTLFNDARSNPFQ